MSDEPYAQSKQPQSGTITCYSKKPRQCSKVNYNMSLKAYERGGGRYDAVVGLHCDCFYWDAVAWYGDEYSPRIDIKPGRRQLIIKAAFRLTVVRYGAVREVPIHFGVNDRGERKLMGGGIEVEVESQQELNGETTKKSDGRKHVTAAYTFADVPAGDWKAELISAEKSGGHWWNHVNGDQTVVTMNPISTELRLQRLF